MAKISFIGLVDIGQILDRKLKSSGHKAQVCPFDGHALDPLTITAISLSEVDVSLLPSEDQVRKLDLSDQGLSACISN